MTEEFLPNASAEEEGFAAFVDVQHFDPDQIRVQLVNGDTVMIEAQHDEKEDNHGLISRHFIRRYILPDDCDERQIVCQLSSDGVLLISAPKRAINRSNDVQEIPIVRTGPFKTEPSMKSDA